MALAKCFDRTRSAGRAVDEAVTEVLLDSTLAGLDGRRAEEVFDRGFAPFRDALEDEAFAGFLFSLRDLEAAGACRTAFLTDLDLVFVFVAMRAATYTVNTRLKSRRPRGRRFADEGRRLGSLWKTDRRRESLER